VFFTNILNLSYFCVTYNKNHQFLWNRSYYFRHVIFHQYLFSYDTREHNLPLIIEKYEHFQKQSYRTRARIASANGVQDLIVPIQHGNKERVPMKDIRIASLTGSVYTG
jgi:hypothetical protein